MNAFKKLLIATACIFLLAYLFLGGDDQPAPRSPSAPPAKPAATTPSGPVPPTDTQPAMGRMTPPWPPAGEENATISLDSSLTRKNFVLILDGSGSMAKQECSGAQTKSEVAKQAVSQWSESVPADANLGLIVFDKNGFSVRLPLGLNNRDQFQAEVAKVVPEYKTPLTKSLDTAYGMLTAQARKQLGYGEYTVVIVTDGIANDIKALARSVNTVLGQSPVMIHTIGFCIAGDHSLNRAGRTSYRSANNPAELQQGLQEVLAEAPAFDLTGFE